MKAKRVNINGVELDVSTEVTEVMIPTEATNISEDDFKDTKRLDSSDAQGIWGRRLTEVEIPTEASNISENAFKDCKWLDESTIQKIFKNSKQK